jgi:hypothetical protein
MLVWNRQPWQPKLAAVGLTGMCLAFLVGLVEGFVKRGQFYPIPLVVAGISLAVAAGLLTGRRAFLWAAVALPAIMLLGASAAPAVGNRLTTPSDPIAFVGTWLQLSTELLALTGGVLTAVARRRAAAKAS